MVLPVLLTLAVLALVPAAAGETIYVMQGETIYWGDRVDLSGLLSFNEEGTTRTFAWWGSRSEPSKSNPPNRTKSKEFEFMIRRMVGESMVSIIKEVTEAKECTSS